MTTRVPAVVAALLWSLVQLAAMPASAQQPDTSALNAEGLRAFADGRYADAADIFGRAYALEPHSELLKNEAVAWYRAERCAEAVNAAHSFLATTGVAANETAQMRSLMGACKVRLAEEAVAADSIELAEKLLGEVEATKPDAVIADRISVVRLEIAKKRAQPDKPSEEPKAPADPLPPLKVFALDEAGFAPTKLQPDTTPAPIEAPPQAAPRQRHALALPLTAAGSALLIGGIVYHLVGKTGIEPKFEETAAAGIDRDRYDSLNRSLRLANVLVPTLYVLGAIGLGSGIYLWIMPARQASDGAVLGLRGSF